MGELIGEKFTRKDFEARTGLKGAEATAALRKMVEVGKVQCHLEMFSHGTQAENAH
ncbi:hypothetical protein [Robbsia andropogonis]|uniref:hypothetical protein n=1 Tax=Robbsia andropogonis TaxID=28092 RepID=UPI00209E4784|nr:hypothetical protein [Robbsia andropogonis]MCP1121590.1 hypothetical protein [Robbsia andropogonis]MCP1131403.1 hypothetical protein [Robbsia andropogonis]